MTKEWFIKPASDTLIHNLVHNLHISPLLARLFVNRGLTTPDAVDAFLNSNLSHLPNPFLLKDMDKAVLRIVQAIYKKEKIVIYGDYDVDGTVSTSLLWHFFNELGHPVSFYVPHRVREGYSLNNAALQKLKEEGAGLVITVDNAIAAHGAIDFANTLNLDVIITDHHEVPPSIPQALAVVNPQRRDCDYPAKEICGAGVAYNLMMALRMRLREEGYFKERHEPNLRKYLDLVALATVADVMPLMGVNRIFVRYGMEQMARTEWKGLKALMDVAKVSVPVDAQALGFYLGPRLNACGRLYEASTGVKMLISRDEAEARRLASELDKANFERREIEKGIVAEAMAMYESDTVYQKRSAVVLFSQNWHPGVVGIVASRLMNKYQKPFIVMAPDTVGGDHLKGSARSFGGINITESIRACGDLVLKCGGHMAASGLTITAKNKALFEEKLDQIVFNKNKENPPQVGLALDGELSLSEMTLAFWNELNRLAPFGNGNPEPVFSARGLVPQEARVVGEKHLKLKFKEKDKPFFYGAIAFGKAEALPLLAPFMDVAFHCQKNTFNNRTSIELKVIDFKTRISI
ncbi:single-stranded-DNA-specific exonuclease RecJ [bacterium]|nr:single-stranded-DNA-specific exonuclease RecJ [bacterium]